MCHLLADASIHVVCSHAVGTARVSAGLSVRGAGSARKLLVTARGVRGACILGKIGTAKAKSAIAKRNEAGQGQGKRQTYAPTEAPEQLESEEE